MSNARARYSLWRRPAVRSLVLTGLTAAAWTGDPASAQARDDHCVFMQSISGWNTISDSAIIIYAGANDAYRVDVAGYCYGLRNTDTIAIDSRDGRLCWPSNNHIVTSYGGRCLVTSVLPMAKRKPEASVP